MLVVSEATVLRKGLKYAGFGRSRSASVNLTTSKARFRAFYGSNPIVYAAILHDIQTTDNPDAQVELIPDAIKPFFMAIHWLYSYRTEHQLSGMFGYCKTKCREYVWFFAGKIQALKEQKVSGMIELQMSCLVDDSQGWLSNADSVA
jgi:hypothetical protein